MKLQILLPVLCLWAFGNPCIAQQSVESPKFQMGLSSYAWSNGAAYTTRLGLIGFGFQLGIYRSF